MRKALLPARASRQLLLACPRRCFAQSHCHRRVFEDGDVVLLRDFKTSSGHDGTIIKLVPGKEYHSNRGVVRHQDIIGMRPRQVMHLKKGAYRIHEPTLAEYVRLTPRIVTPIYPADANIIVSFLDIHATQADSASGASLEILEAGTGHGALTLHLARAIHAANPPKPRGARFDGQQDAEDPVYLGEAVDDLDSAGWISWKKNRRAVVHTLDISSKHSKHARKIVEGFKNGLYAGNVDFHVGDVSQWVEDQRLIRQTEDPFLSHILLDMPEAEVHLSKLAPALNIDGILTVFNPSITQLIDCLKVIREQQLPLWLDQVIELGASTMRQWDVRAVQRRQKLDTSAALESSKQEPIPTLEDQAAVHDELAREPAKPEERWVTVCRPKVGQLVVGGGFLGVWRRMGKAEPADAKERSG